LTGRKPPDEIMIALNLENYKILIQKDLRIKKLEIVNA
jgi:hypothetical protein